ncbi:putative beta-1,3-glucanase [Streptomyces sp. Tu6071]|nr:putative beta-1,3-glucanase [Streptomyces sp. Tu6071]
MTARGVEGDGLLEALAGGGLVDGAPVGAVVGDVDAVRLRVGGVPLEDDAVDRGVRAEVDGDPAGVGPAALGARGPAARGVAVECLVGRAEPAGAVVLRGRGGALLPVREEDVAARLRAARATGRVDLELPERVAVLGGALGAEDADVAARAGDVERLVAAGAVGGGADRRPLLAVGRDLDLVALGVGGFPAQHDLADRRAAAQVDLEPLVVAELAGPAGAVVAVDGGRGGEGTLLAGGGGGLALRDEYGRGGDGPAGGGHHREGEQERDGGEDGEDSSGEGSSPAAGAGGHANSSVGGGGRAERALPPQGETRGGGSARQES